jgi:hypothetical protein
MKSTSLIAVIYAACVAISNADIIYNIDFEPPAYTNGQQIGGGSTRTVSDSIPGFSSQALLLHDGGGINYFAPATYTTGIHLISWDFAIPSAQGSSAIIHGLIYSGSGDDIFDVNIAGSTSSLWVEYGSGFPQRPSVLINPAQSYTVAVLIDLDSNYYNFWLDGTMLEDTISIPSGADIWYVGFGQNQTMGLQAGIDNFRWEVIPEPSSLLLILLGGSALVIARRNARIRNKALNHRLHTYG